MGIKEFIVDLYNGITKNMKEWAKIVIGIPFFVSVLVLAPFCIIAMFLMFIFAYPLDWILTKIGKVIKPLVFKE